MIAQDTDSEKENNANGDYKATSHRGGFRHQFYFEFFGNFYQQKI